MSKTPSSSTIASQVYDKSQDFPETFEELNTLLVKAARLGKISGLRRARKNFRKGEGVEDSIKRTYQALGADTDAYEVSQAEKRQAHLDAALGTAAYGAGLDAMFAGSTPADVPTPRPVKDSPQA